MIEFKMPSLGADMEDGTLVEWLKKPGDRVNRGDIIAEIETQKGLIEIEIFDVGVIDQLLLKSGDKVKVGTVIALINDQNISDISPKSLAVETAQNLNKQTPDLSTVEHFRASPLAKKMALESGISLADLKGTGEGGAITKEDVQIAISAQSSPPESIVSASENTSGIRMAVAAAMSKSNREIPHYFLESKVDMQSALDWLTERNRQVKPKERLLPIVLFIKAVALALKQVPALNAEWKDGLILKPNIHIGLVISLRTGGIIVPAIHNANEKTLDQLMTDINDLIPRARSQKLRSSELSDSTFTISAMGETGADSIFGIIYPPQTGLIGIGKISEQPWAENGMLDVRQCVQVTLAADHRASDGLQGSRLLFFINQYLQNPDSL